VTTYVGKLSAVGQPTRLNFTYLVPGELSLAIPLWVITVSTSEASV